MKSLFLFALMVGICQFSFAQCDYYFLQQHKTITLGFFNNKGSQNGSVVYKTGASANNKSTLVSELFDKKGKSITKSSGTVACQNGVLLMDMKMMLSPTTGQTFSAEANGKGMYLEYPAKLSPGQELKDGTFEMDIQMNGIPATVTMNITDRKVIAKESVATPAGTWDAFRISYSSKTIINMGVPIPMKMDMTEWFVPNFGIIKSESKSGKTELLSIQ